MPFFPMFFKRCLQHKSSNSQLESSMLFRFVTFGLSSEIHGGTPSKNIERGKHPKFNKDSLPMIFGPLFGPLESLKESVFF